MDFLSYRTPCRAPFSLGVWVVFSSLSAHSGHDWRGQCNQSIIEKQSPCGRGVADPSLSYDQAPRTPPHYLSSLRSKALDHRNRHRRHLHKLGPQPIQSLRVRWVVLAAQWCSAPPSRPHPTSSARDSHPLDKARDSEHPTSATDCRVRPVTHRMACSIAVISSG